MNDTSNPQKSFTAKSSSAFWLSKNRSKPDFSLAHEIIEIHHAAELGDLPKTGRTLPVADAIALLAPLCPTGHRILHAKPSGGSFTIAELRKCLLGDSQI
jgi:hypothetical protein